MLHLLRILSAPRQSPFPPSQLLVAIQKVRDFVLLIVPIEKGPQRRVSGGLADDPIDRYQLHVSFFTKVSWPMDFPNARRSSARKNVVDAVSAGRLHDTLETRFRNRYRALGENQLYSKQIRLKF
jgi:hypothetical protein